MSAWAVAGWECKNDPLIDALSASALRTINATKNITNMSWAVATLEYTHKPLLNAISAAAIRILSQFGLQELTNSAWAVATLEFRA